MTAYSSICISTFGAPQIVFCCTAVEILLVVNALTNKSAINSAIVLPHLHPSPILTQAGKLPTGNNSCAYTSQANQRALLSGLSDLQSLSKTQYLTPPYPRGWARRFTCQVFRQHQLTETAFRGFAWLHKYWRRTNQRRPPLVSASVNILMHTPLMASR